MERLLRDLTLTFLKKDKDYGSAVITTHAKFGDNALRVRLSDKILRFKTLYSKPSRAEVEEKLDDTVKDMLVYLAIHWCLCNEGTIHLNKFVGNLTFILNEPEESLNNLADELGEKILNGDTTYRLIGYIHALLGEQQEEGLVER